MTPLKPSLPTDSAYAFATREMLAIHRMMDLHGVPRKVNGELQSAGQRVAIYLGYMDHTHGDEALFNDDGSIARSNLHAVN